METKFTKAKEKSLNQYIEEKHTQEECIGFIDGYEKALKDSKVPEMFEILESVLELQKENYGSGMNTHLALITKAKEIEQLLKEATEL